MRCISCDEELNDYESTRRYENGEYLDMCNDCYHVISSDVVAVGRIDLLTVNDEE